MDIAYHIRWLNSGLLSPVNAQIKEEIRYASNYYGKTCDVTRTWYVVDGNGQTLGRLASTCAHVLKGKHKPTYTPNVDCGDYVIVINADKSK